MALKVDVDDSQLAKKIAKMTGAQLAPVFQTVGNAIVNRIRLCFKLSVSPWGEPWAPLKFRAPRRTNNGKRLSATGRAQVKANAAGAPGKPLVNTGRLRSSIVAKADAKGVTIGTNVKGAATHQFGATIVPKTAKRLVFPGPNGALIFAKKVTIPARPFLPIRGGQVVLPFTWAAAVVEQLKLALKKGAK